MTTRRTLASNLDVIAAQLAAIAAELRTPEPAKPGTTSTSELVMAVEELTDRIGRLEQAKRRGPQTSYSLYEVASQLGLPDEMTKRAAYQRLRRMVSAGQLKAFRVGRSFRVSAAELERLLTG